MWTNAARFLRTTMTIGKSQNYSRLFKSDGTMSGTNRTNGHPLMGIDLRSIYRYIIEKIESIDIRGFLCGLMGSVLAIIRS